MATIRKREASIRLKFVKMATKQFLAHFKCIGCQKLGKAGQDSGNRHLFVTPGFIGGPCRVRTCDHLIKSQMLYQLS
jgi:hypothetical protein